MWRTVAALVLLAAMASGASAQPEASAPGAVTAFVRVAVVQVDRNRVVPDQTVVVRGGRIVALGPATKVRVPEGATRVEGTNRFLMPGIAEMHGHLPGENVPEEIWRGWLQLFVANGVTTVRGMQGSPNQIPLRERVARGEVLGPRLFLYSPPFQRRNTPTPEAGVQKVREYRKAGYDGIKVLEGMTLPVFEAVAKAAKEQKMPFGGHVPNDVGLERALAAGQKSIDHLDGFVEALAGDPPPAQGADPFLLPPETLAKVDERKLARLVAATKKVGAVVVPTMVVWRTLFGDATAESLAGLPELKYVPEATEWLHQKTEDDKTALPIEHRRALMAVRDRVLAALSKAGNTVMLGSDAPQLFSVPGFALRNEVQAMVKAGMTPRQVVEAATIAPARYLGLEKDFGTVAVGKRADLILVDGNPLDDVANIFRSSGVMINGRWLPRAELDAMLADIEQFARARRFPSASEVKDLPVPAAESAPLVGNYAHPNGVVTLVVAADKDRLTISARDPKGTNSHRLQSQGGGTFLIPAIFARITFAVRDGRAAKLVFSQGGSQLEAARAPK